MTGAVKLLLPWGAAGFLFKPRYRLLPEDPVMSLLGRVRAFAGLVMTLGIAVWYGAFADLGLEPLLNSLAFTALLAIPSSLICMASWSPPPAAAGAPRWCGNCAGRR